LVIKPGLVLIFIAILLSTTLFATNAASLSLLERTSSVNVSENSSAYLSISCETPIYVLEGQIIEDELMVLTNRLSDVGMNVLSISPQSVNRDEFSVDYLTYAAGPYYGGESCHVMGTIEGIITGEYVVPFDVEVYWGANYSNAVANVRILAVDVTIIVQSPV
jgi:hypothetical protein